jgi:hypothetical protein
MNKTPSPLRPISVVEKDRLNKCMENMTPNKRNIFNDKVQGKSQKSEPLDKNGIRYFINYDEICVLRQQSKPVCAERFALKQSRWSTSRSLPGSVGDIVIYQKTISKTHDCQNNRGFFVKYTNRKPAIVLPERNIR